MSPSTQIFARKFKVKHFTSKFTNTKVKRNDEVIEYSNFFKFRFDWEAKYHFELFLFNDPIDGRHYLVVYLYLVCPPVLLKNEEQFYLKMATLNDKHEKKHEKEWSIAFENNECKGWYKFLSYEDITGKVLRNDKLTISCEVVAH